MAAETDFEAVKRSAERLYGAGQVIWDPLDDWNRIKRDKMDAFASRHALSAVEGSHRVIDIGSGCEGYAWVPERAVRLDKFPQQIERFSNGIVGDAENIPFDKEYFDFIICIGAVINYASAAEAISEFARVIKRGGSLLLHFESSMSAEHLFSRIWGSNVARISTINSGREDNIWVYNPEYIFDMLRYNGFQINIIDRFHTLSAFGLRVGLSQGCASKLSCLDRYFKFLENLSDDVILLAERS